MHHSTGNPTKAEQGRMEAMVKLGCVACAELGIPNGRNIQVHHLLEGNRRLGHDYSIPLCIQHHLGYNWQEMWGVIPEALQISISDGRKAWNAAYPSERELWGKVQDRLRLSKDWVPTKVLLRAV